jgi:exopolysaccharide biosynthesis polyprenyl glycosylphosphotransferase
MTVIRPRPAVGPVRARLPFGPGVRTTSDFSHAGNLTETHYPQRTPVRSPSRSWARQYRTRLRLTDTLIILISTAGAFVARFGIGNPRPGGSRFDFAYLTISIVIALVWSVSLYAYRTRDSQVVGVGVTEYKRVANASAVAFGILAIAFLIGKVDIARGYFVVALPLGAAMLVVSRWVWRQWLLRQRRLNRFLSRALVVGQFDDVEYVVRQIQERAGAAYHVVGASVEHAAALRDRSVGVKHDVPIVSSLMDASDAAFDLGVDSVIMAGQQSGGSQFVRNLSWELEGRATELVLASRLTDVAGPRIHFRPVEGLPLIQVEIPQFVGGKHVMKRVLDLAASGFGLLILSPLLLLTAFLIRRDSPGGALFRQDRVGRNGTTFTMLKFRSMVQDAESALVDLQAKNEGSGLLFKMKNDPRVTGIGRILRKYSLDELPQLWNVFVGDMSLVGPRPPLRREVDGYESHVHRRLYIKPGLTGMWQVNGRSDLSWDESVRLDLYYVENWSLTGDLVILWRTVRVLLHPTGAY